MIFSIGVKNNNVRYEPKKLKGGSKFMKLQITIEMLKKEKWYLARIPELDFVTQGKTKEEAKKNLLEVVNIQFVHMREIGTLEDYLLEYGVEIEEGKIISKTEVMELEKSMVLV